MSVIQSTIAKQPTRKFFIDETNRVTKLLGDTFGGVRLGRPRVKGHPSRGKIPQVDIVSEKLCNDIVEYLAPTLEQHKGCTLLDVHPGACLLSSKLHDFLKPKRHILMEPDERYYEPFMKPLLDKPDSAYRWSTLSGAHPTSYWGNYRKLLDDATLCEPREELAMDDPGRRKLDPSMLLIGNLTRRYNTRSLGYGTLYWNLVMQHMGHASLTNDMLHRDGLVRMLWWMSEDEKSFYFPLTETWRQNFTTALSLAADTSEVVGTKEHGTRDTRIRSRRPDVLESLVAQRAMQSAREKGMSIPEGRELLDSDAMGKATKVEVVSPLEIVSHTLDDLHKEVNEAFDLLEQIQDAPDRKRYVHPLASEVTFVFPQAIPVAQNRVVNKPMGGDYHRLAVHLELMLRTIRLEATFAELEETLQQRSGNPDPKTMNSATDATLPRPSTDDRAKQSYHGENEQTRLHRLRERILQLDEEHMVTIAPRGTDYHDIVITLADEQIAALSPRPLLQRDRRPYPALKADMTEFWPRSELMLIDMVPSSRDISVPDLASAPEARKVCHEVLKKLFEKRSAFLHEGLGFLAPNAAQDLMPMVPELSDARKGGRLNPRRVRVRMLTDDMVEGLVKAFIEWPFRPSTLELELSSSSSSGFMGHEADESFGVGVGSSDG